MGHMALHTLLGCAGAAAQSESCGAGGAGALSGVVLSQLIDRLDEDKKDASNTATGRQARENLINTIVAGIAYAVDSSSATTAQRSAGIEVENNSFYKYRDQVARFKARISEEALAQCGADNACLKAAFQQADKMAAAYDTTLLLRHYPALSKDKADLMAQAVLDLAPGVSNASSLYELVTGKTATGDDANRFFAAIGVVPVFGGIMKKGAQAVSTFALVDKAFDAGKVNGVAAVAGIASDASKAVAGQVDRVLGGVSTSLKEVDTASSFHKTNAAVDALPQVVLNRRNGALFEKQVIEALSHVGATKNTQLFTVQLDDGSMVTTIPDLWGKTVGGLLEIKNVVDLSYRKQLRAQVRLANEERVPFNLVVSPRTQSISEPLRDAIKSTGGSVYKYDPNTGVLTNFLSK